MVISMKKFKRIIFLLMLAVICSLLPSKHAGAYTVFIDKENVNAIDIGIGTGYKVEIDASYQNKNVVYSYYTSDKKIVEVNKSTGALKGIKTGKAIITCKVTIAGKTTVFGTGEITVKDVQVEKGPYLIPIEGEFIITDRIYYRNPEATYQYTSSKPSIATVNKYGTVKGIKAGTTKITVKEVFKGKTRTVGTVTIQVEASTIAESWVNSYQLGASKEGFFVLTSDTKINTKSFIEHSISGAVYKFTSGDNTMMVVEKRGNVSYLVPLKAGVTTLTVEETYKGKTRIVGRVYAAIDLRKYLKINAGFIVSTDTSYVTVSDGVEGSIDSLLYVADIKEHLVDSSNLDITYTSSKDEVVEIDNKTGIFKVKKPGEATITAAVSGNEVKIVLKVKEKGAMGKIEEKGFSAIEQINTLVKTEITSANASELWREINRLNRSIGYHPNEDWDEEETNLYRANGNENYWAVPNFAKLTEFSKKVVDFLEKEANELLAKQEIVSVSVVKKDSLNVEFKYPMTENFYTYFAAISVEGNTYEAMLSCNVFNPSKEGYRYGLLMVKPDAKIIELNLSSNLEKGTYLLQCSDLLGLPAFEFTYK